MGFKKQRLTKVITKKQQNQVQKKFNQNLHKYYKKIFKRMSNKYPSQNQLIALNFIMSRGSMPTKISSQVNRQLALLDIDKIISYNQRSLQNGDQRSLSMKMVVDIEGFSLNNLVRNSVTPIFRRMNQNQQLYEGNQIGNNMNQNNERTDQIMRLVRAARIHYLFLNRRQQNQLQNNRNNQELFNIQIRREINPNLDNLEVNFNTQQLIRQQNEPSRSLQNIQIQQNLQAQEEIQNFQAQDEV